MVFCHALCWPVPVFGPEISFWKPALVLVLVTVVPGKQSSAAIKKVIFNLGLHCTTLELQHLVRPVKSVLLHFPLDHGTLCPHISWKICRFHIPTSYCLNSSSGEQHSNWREIEIYAHPMKISHPGHGFDTWRRLTRRWIARRRPTPRKLRRTAPTDVDQQSILDPTISTSLCNCKGALYPGSTPQDIAIQSIVLTESLNSLLYLPMGEEMRIWEICTTLLNWGY